MIKIFEIFAEFINTLFNSNKREKRIINKKKKPSFIKKIFTRKKSVQYDDFGDKISEHFSENKKMDYETKMFHRWQNNRKLIPGETSEDIKNEWERHKKIKSNILQFEEESFNKYHTSDKKIGNI